MNKVEIATNYFNEGNFSEAEKTALEIFFENPSSEDAVDVLAAIYLKTSDLSFLKNNFKEKLSLLRKLAVFLGQLDMSDQSLFFYKKALEIQPHDYVAYNNIGLIYEKQDLIDKAKNAYLHSNSIQKNYPAVYNLGVLYRKLKDLKQSEIYLKEALKLDPKSDNASYSLAATYFMNKNFETGYPYFLNRPIKHKAFLPDKYWDGSVQSDKTILVYSEYGLGDAIMLSRYLPFLKDYFKNVVVYIQPPLIKLFENSFKDIKFTSDISEIEYDVLTFMMDLPYYLKMDFNSIPSKSGYLCADENKIKEYKEKYFNNNQKKIGLFYIGGELKKRNAKYRAIELYKLEKLLSLENSKFYSFQKDDLFEELKNFPQIVDLGKTFDDFTDTLAAMKNLDIMVTIDSSPVHLAGASGIKTILMLPYYAEWRWFNEENTTSWYESVDVIRQTTPCDWQSVVDVVYDKLKAL